LNVKTVFKFSGKSRDMRAKCGQHVMIALAFACRGGLGMVRKCGF
jgi:hypothetical protein